MFMIDFLLALLALDCVIAFISIFAESVLVDIAVFALLFIITILAFLLKAD